MSEEILDIQVSELYTGRPDDKRITKEERVYDLLDRLNVSYKRVDHDEAMTVAICEKIDDKLGTKICKNLFLCNASKKKFFLLMMPGEKKFVTKEVSAQIGCGRLSFAGEEYMQAFLDITPGSVSVLGLMNDMENRVQLLIDSDLLKEKFVGCHPCINTSSLSISIDDLLNVYLPEVNHEPIIVNLGDQIV